MVLPVRGPIIALFSPSSEINIFKCFILLSQEKFTFLNVNSLKSIYLKIFNAFVLFSLNCIEYFNIDKAAYLFCEIADQLLKIFWT